MSFRFSYHETPSEGSFNRDFNDAEKGQHDTSGMALAPLSKVYASEKANGHLTAFPAAHDGNMSSATQSTSSFHNYTKSDSSLPILPKQKIAPPPSKKQEPKKSTLFILWFNTYKRLFVFVVTLNLVGIVLTSWAPLRMKLMAASFLQHVGGVHSGCALSGTAWLVYYIVQILSHRSIREPAVLITGIVTVVFIITSVVSALPWVRNNHHNIFERYHRFAGWLGLAATWSFVVLSNSYDATSGKDNSNAQSLITTENIWFTIFMTILIALPWVTVRQVPVEVEIPSSKVAVLRFNRGMQQGLLGRIGRSALMEYHAFGIISEGRHSPYHYMVCGVQGDFTKSLVANPPTKIWTRELKFAGIGHASAMFKRGIRVCTGTGIGAALSTCIQNKNWFLIWIGSDQYNTFGSTISRLIHDNIEPDRMILWDTKERGGRPDTMQLLRDTWNNFGAEVIFITSNMKGNDEMMQGCREEGMHAFGTLWDF
ncbi:non-ribosomal peptide synthetase [Fusarium pseudoanthophilum]|uniref:Non-ribosomal peptide synthetase n=1 Tax=Fusarium pseudoanthophilum TaxID=48495 RepID=A0A8H5PM36_9HYPO|nr:non-ribosomal peptide synthetase [Fusarium pseudoanthophilum]